MPGLLRAATKSCLCAEAYPRLRPSYRWCGGRLPLGRRGARGAGGGPRLWLHPGLLLEPGRELLGRHDLHQGAHRRVPEAAELGAHHLVGPDAVRGHLDLIVDVAAARAGRDRVALDPPLLDPEGVDDVERGQMQVELAPDRHDELL